MSKNKNKSVEEATKEVLEKHANTFTKLAESEEQDKEALKNADVTFCAVWNETRKHFDMLTIYLNGATEEVLKIERTQTRYDNKARAMYDMLTKVTEQSLKR